MSVNLDLNKKLKTYAVCGSFAAAGLFSATWMQSPADVSRGIDDAGHASVVITPSLGQLATIAGGALATGVAALGLMGLGKIKEEERKEATGIVEGVGTKKIDILADDSDIPFTIQTGENVTAVNMAALKKYMGKSIS